MIEDSTAETVNQAYTSPSILHYRDELKTELDLYEKVLFKIYQEIPQE